uniref:Uncharacterized protein n=1 Tax=Timema monikensis TaxID=170555 RepID=A0A7R9HL06_9NEOP|nr:unnamed protein product [Timema monikensis]
MTSALANYATEHVVIFHAPPDFLEYSYPSTLWPHSLESFLLWGDSHHRGHGSFGGPAWDDESPPFFGAVSASRRHNTGIWWQCTSRVASRSPRNNVAAHGRNTEVWQDCVEADNIKRRPHDSSLYTRVKMVVPLCQDFPVRTKEDDVITESFYKPTSAKTSYGSLCPITLMASARNRAMQNKRPPSVKRVPTFAAHKLFRGFYTKELHLYSQSWISSFPTPCAMSVCNPNLTQHAWVARRPSPAWCKCLPSPLLLLLCGCALTLTPLSEPADSEPDRLGSAITFPRNIVDRRVVWKLLLSYRRTVHNSSHYLFSRCYGDVRVETRLLVTSPNIVLGSDKLVMNTNKVTLALAISSRQGHPWGGEGAKGAATWGPSTADRGEKQVGVGKV